MGFDVYNKQLTNLYSFLLAIPNIYKIWDNQNNFFRGDLNESLIPCSCGHSVNSVLLETLRPHRFLTQQIKDCHETSAPSLVRGTRNNFLNGKLAL
jgi:hypothetical protein